MMRQEGFDRGINHRPQGNYPLQSADSTQQEWDTLVWLVAEQSFRTQGIWPRCGGYCSLSRGHSGAHVG